MTFSKRFALLLCAATLMVPLVARGATDKSKETPGIAAYQSTQGAFKRDRKISRRIIRREHRKRSSEAAHTARHLRQR